MDTTMMIALGMLATAVYSWLLKKGKKRLAYLIPLGVSCLVIGYNLFYNPSPLTTTMLIAAVFSIVLLSALLAIPIYFLNRRSN